MKNPFRSEAEAYRFVIGTVVYFAAIVIATASGRPLVGLGVFVVLSVLVPDLVLPPRGARAASGDRAASSRSAEDERRILVVANETVVGRALRDAIESAAEGGQRERARRLAGAELAAQALDVRRGPGARRRGGPAAPERRGARAARDQRARRGRRRRSAAGDRGRAAHVRRGRDHHLDPSRGPLELARARRRHVGAASASRCRSRTSSSISTPKLPASRPGLQSPLCLSCAIALRPLLGGVELRRFELPSSPWSPSSRVGLTGPGVGEGCDPAWTARRSCRPCRSSSSGPSGRSRRWPVAPRARPARPGPARASAAAPGLAGGVGTAGAGGATGGAGESGAGGRAGVGAGTGALTTTWGRIATCGACVDGAACDGCDRAPDERQLDPHGSTRAARPVGDRRLVPRNGSVRAREGLGAEDGRPRVRPGLEDGRTPCRSGPRPSSHSVATTEPTAAQATVADPRQPAEIGPHVPRFPADN